MPAAARASMEARGEVFRGEETRGGEAMPRGGGERAREVSGMSW